jgi:hypothetical protein
MGKKIFLLTFGWPTLASLPRDARHRRSLWDAPKVAQKGMSLMGKKIFLRTFGCKMGTLLQTDFTILRRGA